MHAVAAFFASIIAVVSSLFASPTSAPYALVDSQAKHTAAAAAATQLASTTNPFFDPSAPPVTPADPAPAFSPPPPQTVINQPVIERIIERVVPQGDAGISADKLTAILTDFGKSIEARLTALNPPKADIPQQVAAAGSSASYYFAPASQRIDQLSNTAINMPTITGGTISGASVSGYLPLSGGTLSGALSAGTLALSGTLTGTDASFSGTLSAGVLNVAGLSSQGALIGPYFTATSTTATSSFAGGTLLSTDGGNVGVGTSTPAYGFHLVSKPYVLASGEPTLMYVQSSASHPAVFEGRNNATSFPNTTGIYVVNNAASLNRRAGVFLGLKGLNPTALISSQTTDIATGYGDLTFGANGASGLLEQARLTSAGNFGIGTTSPGALLSAAGNILGAGTLALTGTTGTTTIASGQGFTIGGSQFVVQQGSGNVGIGTTTPSGPLEVWGANYPVTTFVRSAALSGATMPYAANLLAINSTNGTPGVGGGVAQYFGGTNSAGAIAKIGAIAGRWRDATNQYGQVAIGATIGGNDVATWPLVVDSQSNVGIGTGTAAPAQQLEISKTGDYQLRLTNSGTGGGYWNIAQTDNTFGTSGGKLVFVPDSITSTNAKVVFTNSGNVGIGTTTPTRKLSIVGQNSQLQLANDTGSPANLLFQNLDTGYGSSNGLWLGVEADETVSVWNYQNTALRLATNNAERLRIDSSGNVGIGTTTPNQKLIPKALSSDSHGIPLRRFF